MGTRPISGVGGSIVEPWEANQYLLRGDDAALVAEDAAAEGLAPMSSPGAVQIERMDHVRREFPGGRGT